MWLIHRETDVSSCEYWMPDQNHSSRDVKRLMLKHARLSHLMMKHPGIEIPEFEASHIGLTLFGAKFSHVRKYLTPHQVAQLSGLPNIKSKV